MVDLIVCQCGEIPALVDGPPPADGSPPLIAVCACGRRWVVPSITVVDLCDQCANTAAERVYAICELCRAAFPASMHARVTPIARPADGMRVRFTLRFDPARNRTLTHADLGMTRRSPPASAADPPDLPPPPPLPWCGRALAAPTLFDRIRDRDWWRARTVPAVDKINRVLVTGGLGVGVSGLPMVEEDE